jgi:putative transposase
VQADGITVNNITYYDPLIDPWIHAVDQKTEKKRKFICRQDPRDVSVLWFLDPEKHCYFRIPYRNPEHPSMTLWEYREVRAQLRAEGVSTVNETLIFETYERLERIRRDASVIPPPVS